VEPPYEWARPHEWISHANSKRLLPASKLRAPNCYARIAKDDKLVVDASVAAKWVVVEPLSDRATSLLQADHQLLVPDLFWAEIGNTFWKKARSGDLTNADCVRRFDALQQMGIETRTHAAIARDAMALRSRPREPSTIPFTSLSPFTRVAAL
jgi:predicted nucleic acid-binding protein